MRGLFVIPAEAGIQRKMIIKKWAKIIKHQEGQSIVETLIVLPLILFFILVIMELAMIYNAKQLCNYAAFCAARTASVYGTSADAKEKMHRSAAIALSCITPTITSDASQIIHTVFRIEPEFLKAIEPLTEGSFIQWPLRFADAYIRSRIDTVKIGSGPERKNVTVELTYYYKCQIFPVGKLIGTGKFEEYLRNLESLFPELKLVIDGIKKYLQWNIRVRAFAKIDYWKD